MIPFEMFKQSLRNIFTSEFKARHFREFDTFRVLDSARFCVFASTRPPNPYSRSNRPGGPQFTTAARPGRVNFLGGRFTDDRQAVITQTTLIQLRRFYGKTGWEESCDTCGRRF